MNQTIDVYGLPNCSTCKKVLRHLRERGAEIGSVRDIKADPLTAEEIRSLAAKVGGADRLFSRRARKYRELGLHEKELGEEDMLRLMTDEYTFVSRPVVVAGTLATAGSSMKRVDAVIAPVLA